MISHVSKSQNISKFAPFAAGLLSVAVLAFLAGSITAYLNVFPYQNIRDSARTLKALADSWQASERTDAQQRIEITEIPAARAPEERLTLVAEDAVRRPILAVGGLDQYLEHCPDHGCLAVAVDARGDVVESWPYRPAEIYAADITGAAYPHEMLLSFDPIGNVYPLSAQRYADGDVLVNFQGQGGIFPFGMGITRVGPDGVPRWTRFDYSHHWSTLSEDGVAYVPSLQIGEGSLRFSYGASPDTVEYSLPCTTERPQLDTIQVVDGEGAVTEEIALTPIFLGSNWAGIVPETTDACDPFHLNYIDLVGENAGPGLAEGDLVLSLRNLSRFAIFDPEEKRIKRVISGGFIQQHSVHHLEGSRFLIFDNRGGDVFGPGSRVVELDIADGTERRIFPNEETPDAFAEVFSDRAGFLDISPDRSRVLASFTHAGRGFEIDIASGRLLAIYDNVHDLSSVSDVPADERGQAWRFSIFGMSYLPQ